MRRGNVADFHWTVRPSVSRTSTQKRRRTVWLSDEVVARTRRLASATQAK